MNIELFKKRLRSLYTSWTTHKHDLWHSSNVLLVSSPPTVSSNSISTTSSFSVSNSFHKWLLGPEIVDTITIFTSKEIHLICTSHTAFLLKPLVSSRNQALDGLEDLGIQIVVHEKDIGGDGGVILDMILSDLTADWRLKYLSTLACFNEVGGVEDYNDGMLVVGHIAGESPVKRKRKGFCVVDVKDVLCRVVGLGEKWDSGFAGLKLKDGHEPDIYLQALSKEAEEMIHLAEEKKQNPDDWRRGKKLIKCDMIDETDESQLRSDGPDEWIFV